MLPRQSLFIFFGVQLGATIVQQIGNADCQPGGVKEREQISTKRDYGISARAFHHLLKMTCVCHYNRVVLALVDFQTFKTRGLLLGRVEDWAVRTCLLQDDMATQATCSVELRRVLWMNIFACNDHLVQKHSCCVQL